VARRRRRRTARSARLLFANLFHDDTRSNNNVLAEEVEEDEDEVSCRAFMVRLSLFLGFSQQVSKFPNRAANNGKANGKGLANHG